MNDLLRNGVLINNWYFNLQRLLIMSNFYMLRIIVSQEEPLIVRDEVEDQLGACAVHDFRFRGGVRQL